MAIDSAPSSPADETNGTALSVVAPVYNEAESLGQLVDELVAVLDKMYRARQYEILLVDDGSTDDSERVMASLSETVAPVEHLALARNYGQSAALAAGIDHASGDIIVTIDADLQNDPADIPQLVATLEDGYDCVSGHRADRSDPLTKTIPSKIQTYLAKFTGPNINDFGCTLTAYRREALRDIDLYGEGHRYIPAKLYERGYDITEVEVNHRARQHGSSHYGVGRLIRGFVDLLWHLIWNRYGKRPMHLLGGTGIIMLALGTGIGTVSVIQRFVFGVPLQPRTPRLILVALLVLFGLQMLVFGTIAEWLAKLYWQRQPHYRLDG